MVLYKIFILLTIKAWISSATEILYVLPDNSTEAVSCPSQPCAKLSQYVMDNGTLPVMSNVEYHFLPGEHHVPANMVLQNLHSFSIIGTVSKPSPLAVLVLADCSQSYIIKIIDSYNVTILNVMLKQCDQSQSTDLFISLCYSCTIQNVVFMNLGLIGENLIGRSNLTEIMMKSNRSTSKFLMLCQRIALKYWNVQSLNDQKHYLMMNQIEITGDRSKCYIDSTVGLHIYNAITVMEGLVISLTNSLFINLDHTALTIISRCYSYGNSKVYIENCTFENNYILLNAFNSEFDFPSRPLIDILVAHDSKSISFKQCKFIRNHHAHILISVVLRTGKRCQIAINHCSNVTNISFVECQFIYNRVTKLINFVTILCKSNLLIIGPTEIKKTISDTYRNSLYTYDVMSIYNTTVKIIGPVIMSFNRGNMLIDFDYCDISFYRNITVKSNKCKGEVIYLKSSYIKVMEYAIITLSKNIYTKSVIRYDYLQSNLNPPCLFQFVTERDVKTVSSAHYSVNIDDNSYALYRPFKKMPKYMRLFPFYYFTPHCSWIPNAAFHECSPKVIYQQIIKTSIQNYTYHKICHCAQNKTINCSVDALGPVYPGQMLQVELCTPFNDKPSTLYAEINSIHLPATACKVAPQTEIINTISNYSKTITFIITSEATSECELFLTAASSDAVSITEGFYVQLRSCPIGFTLQRGVCDCDPVLSSYIGTCHIDNSAIRRPASTWITVYTQGNDKYLISSCPMDYCLPHSSNISLLHSDLQCQFNRAGLLCSQCQHHLSMVFGSSRCMKCTNAHILIIIIIIVAGIVLVTSLYLFNLTVTNGTINGMIFYANVVSINDSTFLVKNNMSKLLQVFISLANLDLGIETCFYNGMDSYAKMWLQLFFPFYLIIIAASIIIASRYSYRILRLTYTRSLPVLATLFLLSYTGVLRTVSTVLFSYSTITHLPSGHQQTVWSIDASVPLFGLKFTVLFITCLVLFLVLIPFNIILLFTRYLLQFRIINRFKPLLDAFQGSYKDRYYFWIAVQITMRSLLFAMHAFQTRLKLILSNLLLIIFSIYNGRIYPYKNNLINIQELSLLINLLMIYAVSYQNSETIFSLITNVMICLAFAQLLIILLYHFLTYTCHCNVAGVLQTLKNKFTRFINKVYFKSETEFDVALLNVPERTFSYAEYQDGLVSDDFEQNQNAM